MQAIALILLLAACGSSPPVAKPKDDSPTPQQLAFEIDDDMVRLARIAHDGRGKCEATIGELQPHVARMQLHHSQAMEMAGDPRKRATLVTEMDRFGKRAPDRAGEIVSDLAVTHRACVARCTPGSPCSTSYQLERVISDIPSY